MKFFWGQKKETPPEPASEPESLPTDPPAAALPDPAPIEEESAPEPAELEPVEPEPKRGGFFSRITAGLTRSSTRLSEEVSALFTKRKLDAAALEELEDVLLAADLGAGPASRVISLLSDEKFDKEVSDSEVREALAKVVADTLAPHERDLDLSGDGPQVVMFVGVNGSGKTTTLGKIAALISREGRKVVLAAGDTFRAAAVEQVSVWGERAGAPVVKRDIGADAAGLVFDAYAEAKAQNADVLLVDTAGRLQNKAGLMEELSKIVRVLKKHDDTAPHHVLLVLDATVGQNAISQADAFTDTAGVTGLIMTKLDGTAKGGVLVALADRRPDLPIYFTGVGEGIDDLQPFDATAFAQALAGVEAP